MTAREAGLAGPRRPPEDQRGEPVGLDRAAQELPGPDDLDLPDVLVERARPHPRGKRLLARVGSRTGPRNSPLPHSSAPGSPGAPSSTMPALLGMRLPPSYHRERRGATGEASFRCRAAGIGSPVPVDSGKFSTSTMTTTLRLCTHARGIGFTVFRQPAHSLHRSFNKSARTSSSWISTCRCSRGTGSSRSSGQRVFNTSRHLLQRQIRSTSDGLRLSDQTCSTNRIPLHSE